MKHSSLTRHLKIVQKIKQQSQSHSKDGRNAKARMILQ